MKKKAYLRTPPTRMPATPWSQPLITSPGSREGQEDQQDQEGLIGGYQGYILTPAPSVKVKLLALSNVLPSSSLPT